LTLDLPPVAQALAERRKQTQHSIVKNADERHLVRLLRPDSERRGKDAVVKMNACRSITDVMRTAARC
jgi:hypothetical protein